MGYVIASGPRSGSWLLADLLGSTAVAGRPGEYACREDVETWRDFHGCATHAEYFFQYPNLMRSANNIFGTKLLYPQWLCLGSDTRRYLRRSSAMDYLESVAGPIHMIQLRRRDQVRQAVSLVLAQQTGIWSTRAGVRPKATISPTYDRQAIEVAFDAVRWQDAGWQQLLASAKAPVLQLDYEDLAADPVGTVRTVLSFLDLPAPAELPSTRLRPQAGPLSQAWVTQARTDLQDRG